MDKDASLLVSVVGAARQSEMPCVKMPGLRGKGGLLCNKGTMGMRKWRMEGFGVGVSELTNTLCTALTPAKRLRVQGVVLVRASDNGTKLKEVLLEG